MNRQWHPVWMATAAIVVSASAAQAQSISITNIQLEEVAGRLELRLQTMAETEVQETINRFGRTVVIDISDAQLEAEFFQQSNPAPGIADISVYPLDDTTVRITITGTTEAPGVEAIAVEAIEGEVMEGEVTEGEVMEGDRPLLYTITPSTDAAETPPPLPTTPDEETDGGLRITVTDDEAPPPYVVPETAVGTRTDTPILEIPQSVQVIPQVVIEEQGISTVNEALRNAAGVSSARVPTDSQGLVPVIRGFETQNVLRNGLRDETFGFGSGTSLANVERVEILRGPASVLYGQGNLGGTLNLVTEQPLDQPLYELSTTLGQFDRALFTVDLTGPLNEEGLAYRLNAAYENTDTFRDFEELETVFVSPVLRAIDTEDANLTLDLEYFQTRSWGGAPELPAAGTVEDNPNGEVDRAVNLGEPSLTESES